MSALATEVVAEIRRLYGRGVSMVVIGLQTKTSQPTVRKYTSDLPRRRRPVPVSKVPPETTEAIRALYLEGVPWAYIIEKFGVPSPHRLVRDLPRRPANGGRPLSAETIAAMRVLYVKGFTWAEISECLGVAKSVRHVADLPRRQRGRRKQAPRLPEETRSS